MKSIEQSISEAFARDNGEYLFTDYRPVNDVNVRNHYADIYRAGYKAALKDFGDFKMGHCAACGNFDTFYAPVEYPNADKELCYECVR